MYDRKVKAIGESMTVKIFLVLFLAVILPFLFSDTAFALGDQQTDAEFYTDYTIVGYKVKLAEKKGKTYTLTDAYTLGDVLCIRSFQTQYPFAAASFNLLSIGNKQSLLSQMTGGFFKEV